MNGVSLIPLAGIPEVKAGDSVAALIGDALETQGTSLRSADVLTIAHKIVSKAEGRVRALADIEPTAEAVSYGRELSKDARKVQAVLDESTRVVRAFKHPHADEGV